MHVGVPVMSRILIRNIDRAIAIVMVISLFFAVASTSVFDTTAEYTAVRDMANQIRVLRQPFILFSTLSLLGVIAAIIGAVMHILRWKYSRYVLLACGACTLASSPMVNVYVQSSLTSAFGFVFAVCLGWLIASPDTRPR